MVVLNWAGLALNPVVSTRIWVWLGTALLLLGSLAWIGHALTGRSDGLLINTSNVMSLSRLQLLIWLIANHLARAR